MDAESLRKEIRQEAGLILEMLSSREWIQLLILNDEGQVHFRNAATKLIEAVGQLELCSNTEADRLIVERGNDFAQVAILFARSMRLRNHPQSGDCITAALKAIERFAEKLAS